MNIKMKIHGIQQDSLLVSFSSEDETPDMYPPCAYQISMFGADMPKEEILKKIAQSGFVQVELQNKRNDPQNQVKMMEFEELVGQELSFEKETTFINPQQQTPEEIQAGIDNARSIFKAEVVAVVRELGLVP